MRLYESMINTFIVIQSYLSDDITVEVWMRDNIFKHIRDKLFCKANPICMFKKYLANVCQRQRYIESLA